jgi:hypothetical protein
MHYALGRADWVHAIKHTTATARLMRIL